MKQLSIQAQFDLKRTNYVVCQRTNQTTANGQKNWGHQVFQVSIRSWRASAKKKLTWNY